MLLFVCLMFGCAGLHCCAGFSLVAESRGSRVAVALGLLTVEASLVAEHTSRMLGPQKLQAPGSRAQDQSLRRTGLVALQHVGSSWIRDWTCVSCHGRRILYHWALQCDDLMGVCVLWQESTRWVKMLCFYCVWLDWGDPVSTEFYIFFNLMLKRNQTNKTPKPT